MASKPPRARVCLPSAEIPGLRHCAQLFRVASEDQTQALVGVKQVPYEWISPSLTLSYLEAGIF